ncbi:MAG: phage major capsid protein [Oscillospiraceae bacterium]|jgi:hypothetical protein|nr:phage major capsid protein [Oscillospiraceae bacterium]
MAFCNSIKLEKGMYTVGSKNFTQVLESLDPTVNYKGTELEGLDAYQRQLKKFDIKVSGTDCNMVEKFFSTTDSAVLFPEFIARAVRQGVAECDILKSILATTTKVDSIDYRAVSSATESSENNSVAEGAAIRNVNVRTKDKLISLKKHGRVFSSSYEALRFQNLDVLTVILKRIGADIANELLTDAVNALISGDGTSGDAADVVEETGAAITYDHLLELWEAVSPYRLNTMLASAGLVKEILALSDMKDSITGLYFQGTGKVLTPMGASLFIAPSVAANTVLGFDKSCALQMIQSGDILVDYDKVIDRQLERATISIAAGFSRLFKDAVKVLTYSAQS